MSLSLTSLLSHSTITEKSKGALLVFWTRDLLPLLKYSSIDMTHFCFHTLSWSSGGIEYNLNAQYLTRLSLSLSSASFPLVPEQFLFKISSFANRTFTRFTLKFPTEQLVFCILSAHDNSSFIWSLSVRSSTWLSALLVLSQLTQAVLRGQNGVTKSGFWRVVLPSPETESLCEVPLTSSVSDEAVSSFISPLNGFSIRLGTTPVWLVGESAKFFKCATAPRALAESLTSPGLCLMCFSGLGCLWSAVRTPFDMLLPEGTSFLGRTATCWCSMSFTNFSWFFRTLSWFSSSFSTFHNSVASCPFTSGPKSIMWYNFKERLAVSGWTFP